MEAQIQLLTDVHSRLQTLRHIPLQLAKGTRLDFQQVKDVAETIRGEAVQEALRRAKESLEADGRDVHPNLRRKRRRSVSAVSPRPYVGLDDKATVVFPAQEEAGLKNEGVSVYIREFNSGHASRLDLWRRTRGGDQAGTVVRLTIPDVLTGYLTLAMGEGGVLETESVTVFGPRERKWPHSQSDYTVYRQLSQQIAKMVQAQPSVAVQSVVDLLVAYTGLFTEQCVGCGRVLTTEGHVPPVVREWNEGWTARHVGCRIYETR